MIYSDNLTPVGLAARLATYISDPSTIRSRVLMHFGRAPTVEQCRNLRRAYETQRRPYITEDGDKFKVYCRRHDGPYEMDENGIDRCVVCAEEKRRAAEHKKQEERLRIQAHKERLEAARIRIANQRIASALIAAKGVAYNGPHADLIGKVCGIFDIHPRDLLGPNRAREFVDARCTLVMLLRQRGESYTAIGRMFPRDTGKLGHMDHTSVIHLEQTYDIRARRNPVIEETVKALTDAA